MSKPLRRYERDLISVAANDISIREFNALVIWNQKHDSRFFVVEHERLRCKQYVGVVQVGGLTIEILPKPDRNALEQDKGRWHGALLTMVQRVHGIKLYSADDADLSLRRTNLMDLFLDLYVNEVRALVHAGLIKRYRTKRSNQMAMKGHLDFPNHLRQNLVHKERFAVVHQTYDTDHMLHSILKLGLEIVTHVCTNAHIVGRAQDVGWAFEQVKNRSVNAASFERLQVGRKTAPYSKAIVLAKLIIFSYNPDFRSGRAPVLSLLFNMEQMWEKFIYSILADSCPEGWSLDKQVQEEFWKTRPVKPDLVFRGPAGVTIIADTKWKQPDNAEPSMGDLQQMFAYNLRFVSERSVLLYPGQPRTIAGKYVNAVHSWFENEHSCDVQYILPFDESGKVDDAKVSEIFNSIIPTVPIAANS